MAWFFDGFLRVLFVFMSHVFYVFLGILVLLPNRVLVWATGCFWYYFLFINSRTLFQCTNVSFPFATIHFIMILYDYFRCKPVMEQPTPYMIENWWCLLQNSGKDVISRCCACINFCKRAGVKHNQQTRKDSFFLFFCNLYSVKIIKTYLLFMCLLQCLPSPLSLFF